MPGEEESSFLLYALPFDILVGCLIPAATKEGSLRELMSTFLLSCRRSLVAFESLSEIDGFWKAVYVATFPEKIQKRMPTSTISAASYWYIKFIRRFHACEKCLTRLKAKECKSRCCARCCNNSKCLRHRHVIPDDEYDDSTLEHEHDCFMLFMLFKPSDAYRMKHKRRRYRMIA